MFIVASCNYLFPLCCREACETALREKHFLDDSQPEGFLDEAGISHMKQLEVLRQVFRKAGEADIPAEVRMCSFHCQLYKPFCTVLET